MDIINQLVSEFNIRQDRAENIVGLIDDGNTIPFIARYRKELTGNCDDQVLRDFSERLTYLRNLEKRKGEVEKSILEQGKLTEEIKSALDNAKNLTEVEDIYRPFKQKKKTKATIAISKGLAPLAEIIFAQEIKSGKVEDIAKDYVDEEKGVKSVSEGIEGACHIIAEMIADDATLRKKLRRVFLSNGEISTKLINKDKEEASTYEMYDEKSEGVAEIKEHRVLAINRGEREEFLKVKVQIDKEFAYRIVTSSTVKGESIFKKLIEESSKDAYDRLIYPSIEREIRNHLTDLANEKSIKAFETNLQSLIMQPPIKGKIVIGLDPGFRTGCKIAVIDETGKFLDKTVIYPTLPVQSKIEEAKSTLKYLIAKYTADVVAIGNGTASRESEAFVVGVLKELDRKVEYVIVNEAGASVYSASKLGAEEFPDFDVSERSAVSIARRIIDPLAELIKIDPKSIGVGQYQHDMPEARLDEVLEGTLVSCVNKVGVDLNTASARLLTFVSGLNSGIAKNIVEYRESKGKIKSRQELLKVKKFGDKTFIQCAGFLRIPESENVLDNTGVHPESYEKTLKLLKEFNFTESDVREGKISSLKEKVESVGIDKVAKSLDLGEETLKDIITELLKPGRDIRDDFPKPILRSDVLSMEDLKEGMELTGTVRNVIDFGAFVDIGVHQDGLVHISQISDGYIKSPADVLKVGDVVKVKVLSVDVKKKRIGLTMKGLKKSAKIS